MNNGKLENPTCVGCGAVLSQSNIPNIAIEQGEGNGIVIVAVCDRCFALKGGQDPNRTMLTVFGEPVLFEDGHKPTFKVSLTKSVERWTVTCTETVERYTVSITPDDYVKPARSR